MNLLARFVLVALAAISLAWAQGSGRGGDIGTEGGVTNPNPTVVRADQQSGKDMCAKIATAWSLFVAQSLSGGIVDATAFTGTQPCAGSMWTGFPYTPTGTQSSVFNGTVLISPTVNIVTAVSQVMPAGATLDGQSAHSWPAPGSLTGAQIQPSNSFPVSTPIIEFGATNGAGTAPTTGIQVRNLAVSCLTPAGTPPTGSIGIRNQYAAEFSGVNNVYIRGCDNAGLVIDAQGTLNGALNSGPYDNLHITTQGTNNAASACLIYGVSAGMGPIKGIHHFGCNSNGTTQGTVGVKIDGVGLTLDDLDVEKFVTGISLGAAHLTSGISIRNVRCVGSVAMPTTDCIHLGSGTASSDVAITGMYTSDSTHTTNLLTDANANGGSIATATELGLGLYARGQAGQILTTSSQIPSNVGAYSSTWAARRAANTLPVGTVVRMTDIGPTAGSLWMTDGTYYKPLNGSAVFARSSIPVCLAPGSGTSKVAVNGIITLETALQATYSGGIWLRFPENVLNNPNGEGAGLSTAGLYWTVMTSSTQGQVTTTFADPTAGKFIPYIPTSPSNAVGNNTGFTQTGGDIILINYGNIPATMLALNGGLMVNISSLATNNNNSKTINLKAGGTLLWSITQNSGNGNLIDVLIMTRNRGVQNSQINTRGNMSLGGIAFSTVLYGYTAIDFASDQALTVTGNIATNTDAQVFESTTIEIVSP
jgi:hypothetical protein